MPHLPTQIDSLIAVRNGAAGQLERLRRVPRYYFNVSCGEYESTDVIGECCPNDVAALSGAMRVASAVLQKRLRAEELSDDGWIEVEDERHRPVLRLPLRAAAY
jgi:hypothetical protein